MLWNNIKCTSVLLLSSSYSIVPGYQDTNFNESFDHGLEETTMV